MGIDVGLGPAQGRPLRPEKAPPPAAGPVLEIPQRRGSRRPPVDHHPEEDLIGSTGMASS
jgi:hypothetical protein